MRGMRLLLVALLVICSTSARAQFGGIQMKTGTGAGTILQGAPYFMFGGAGITCAYDSTSQSDKCTVAAGAGGTLQQAYNNGGAGITTIIEDTTRLGIAIRDSSPSQGTATIFGVQSNDGTTTKFLDIPATGSITMSSGQTSTASPQYVFGGATDYATPGTVAFRLQQNSPAKTYFEIAPTANGPTVNYKDGNGNTQVSTSINSGSQWVIGSAAAIVRSGSVDFGTNNNAWTNGYFTNVLAATSAALTITANAASTWSTSAAALTISGFAGINEQVNGTTVVDVGVTTSTAVTLAANKGLIGAAGTGVVTLGSMTGDMTLPTGNLSWAAAATKTGSLVSAGAFTITAGAASAWSSSAGALTITSNAAATWGVVTGAVTLTGSTGVIFSQTPGGTIADVGVTVSTAESFAAGKGIAMASKLLVVNTAPTISAGFGAGASIDSSNGTASFRINTGAASASGTIGLPTASTGWNCLCNDITSEGASGITIKCSQTGGTSSTAIIGNFTAAGVSGNWGANDIVQVICTAY